MAAKFELNMRELKGTHGTDPMELQGGQVGLEKHTTPQKTVKP